MSVKPPRHPLPAPRFRLPTPQPVQPTRPAPVPAPQRFRLPTPRHRPVAPPEYDATDAVQLAKRLRELAAMHWELTHAEELSVTILAGKILHASVNNSARGGHA